MTATTTTEYTTDAWQTVATGADEFSVWASVPIQYAFGASAPALTVMGKTVQPNDPALVVNLPASRSLFVRPVSPLGVGGIYRVSVTSSAM